MELISFLPRVDGPLVVELVEFLRNHENVIMAVDFGVWDFLGSGNEDNPQVAIKSVRNSIPRDFLEALTRSRIPIKIILVEGQNPDLDTMKAQSILLAANGVGVYVRNFGWLTLPQQRIVIDANEETLARTRGWVKGEDSVWRKRCRWCKQYKTTDEYYSSGRSEGRDPYRPACKECDNAQRRARYARSKV